MAMEAEATGYDGPGATEMEYGTYASPFPENLEGMETHVLHAKPKHRMTEEEKFAREVERRRISELERRQRIFDAKRRTIGQDVQMLNAQVVEKEKRMKQEQADDRREDRDLLRCDRQLKLLEIEKQQMKRNMEVECKETSLRELNFAARREYDLNDPLHVRKGIPARLGDDDLRCGVSGMQRFNGEDLMREERVRQQHASQVDFIEQQKFERAMLNVQAQNNSDTLAQEVADITALRNEMEETEGNLRKELQRAQQNDNLAKAADNVARRVQEMDHEQGMNARELDFSYRDPFLNENTEVMHNGRIKRDMFKGSNREERCAVMQQQIDQCDDKAYNRELKRIEDRNEARQAEHTRKQLVAMEREKQRMRRGMMEDMAAHNGKQDDQQKQSIKALDEAYTNKFSDDFFHQFGKQTR